MKKFSILVALCLVIAMAAPALAVDVSFSGVYRVRALLDYNRGVYENTGVALSNNQDDWFDMRLRFTTEFKVADNLKLITRIDAWDNAVWGTGAAAEETINMDRIYIEYTSPIGFFRIGRASAGNWGTDFAGDSSVDEDQISYVLPVGKFYIGLKYAKVVENDFSSLSSANTDFDKWIASVTYRGENVTGGLLYGLYDDESNTLAALSGAAGGLFSTSSTQLHLLTPYFKATFGDLYLEGEYIYGWGQIDFDRTGFRTIDLEASALWFKAAYTMGPATIFGAYAYAEGDADDLNSTLGGIAPEKEYNAILPITSDGDFTPLLILWDSNNQKALGANIGGWDYLGANNLNSYFGASCFVFGGTYQVNEKVGLGLTIGYAEADDVPSGWDDDYGWEYDISLTWQIQDNLKFTSIFAYLDAGDIYKGNKNGALAAFLAGDFAGAAMTPGPTTDIENPMFWYNELTLSF